MIRRGNCIIPGIISEEMFSFLENLVIKYNGKGAYTLLSYVYGDELKTTNLSYTVCELPGGSIIVIANLKFLPLFDRGEKEYLIEYFKKLVYGDNRELKHSFCKNTLGIECSNARIIFIDDNNKVLISLKRNHERNN